MGHRINKYLCKRFGHEWDEKELGDPTLDTRTCLRCGRSEKGTIFTNDNKEMDVKWEEEK